MKKVSVTDRYTYDGKEMSEREKEIYFIGIKDGEDSLSTLIARVTVISIILTIVACALFIRL